MKYGFFGKYSAFLLSFAVIIYLFASVLTGCGGGGGGESGGGVTTPTPSTTPGLDPGTKYYWQVEACSSSGDVTTGPQWSFTTSSKSRALLSGELSQDDASVIAENFIAQDQNRKAVGELTKDTGRRSLKTGSLFTLKSKDNKGSLAYIFDLSPAGYVVVPCSNLLPPVLAYSYTSDFQREESSQNVLLYMIRRDISLRLKAISDKKMDKHLLSENIIRRSDLLGSKNSNSREGSIWGPLFRCGTWSQEEPYNALCPMDPETGKRTVVGCVATSLAQHLNYWQQPVSVSLYSSDSYTTATRQISIDAPSAGFSSLNYNGGNPSNEARQSLGYACGVLVKMDYTSDESGASVKT
jgi:hypothetical protein